MNSTQCDTQKVVRGYVYLDVNNNRVKDESEKGIKKLKVDLIKDGDVINTVATLDTGYYEFNICDGIYTIFANYEHGENSDLEYESISVNTSTPSNYDFRVIQQGGNNLDLIIWGVVGVISLGMILLTKYLSMRTPNSL